MSPGPTDVFKCLSDDTRAKMLLLIQQEQELCVCELTFALDQSQPKISRHLALLRRAGLLADRRQGQWVYYRLHDQLPDWIHAILQTTRTANGSWLKDSLDRLAQMGDRPTRTAANCC